jgi:ATPase family AAA domain-containing protein 3A/B
MEHPCRHRNGPRRLTAVAVRPLVGTQSKNFVMVLATNRPADLDRAVIDRIDEMVEFPLPTRHERFQLVELYFNMLLRKRQKLGGSAISVRDVNDEHFSEIAARTEGYSGRGLSKLMISVQGHAYAVGLWIGLAR